MLKLSFVELRLTGKFMCACVYVHCVGMLFKLVQVKTVYIFTIYTLTLTYWDAGFGASFLPSEHLQHQRQAPSSCYPLSHGLCGMCARYPATKEGSAC